MRTCSKCSGGELIRSRRRGYEWVLSWLDIFPYRCDACWARSYSRGNDLEPRSLPVPEHGKLVP